MDGVAKSLYRNILRAVRRHDACPAASKPHLCRQPELQKWMRRPSHNKQQQTLHKPHSVTSSTKQSLNANATKRHSRLELKQEAASQRADALQFLLSKQRCAPLVRRAFNSNRHVTGQVWRCTECTGGGRIADPSCALLMI